MPVIAHEGFRILVSSLHSRDISESQRLVIRSMQHDPVGEFLLVGDRLRHVHRRHSVRGGERTSERLKRRSLIIKHQRTLRHSIGGQPVGVQCHGDLFFLRSQHLDICQLRQKPEPLRKVVRIVFHLAPALVIRLERNQKRAYRAEIVHHDHSEHSRRQGLLEGIYLEFYLRPGLVFVAVIHEIHIDIAHSVLRHDLGILAADLRKRKQKLLQRLSDLFLDLMNVRARIDRRDESLLQLKGRELVLVDVDESEDSQYDKHPENHIHDVLVADRTAHYRRNRAFAVFQFHNTSTFIPVDTFDIPSTMSLSPSPSPSVTITPLPENPPMRTFVFFTQSFSSTVQT